MFLLIDVAKILAHWYSLAEPLGYKGLLNLETSLLQVPSTCKRKVLSATTSTLNQVPIVGLSGVVTFP